MDYMEGVARRELLNSGAISFADKKYSEVVATRNTFNKFNPIDNMADRTLLKKFMGADMIQTYLANPEAAMFQKLIAKDRGFPSTRNARLFPWMEFGLKAHMELAMHYNHKLFDEPDTTNKEIENFVDTLVGEGSMKKKQGLRFVRKNLGMGPGILGYNAFRVLRAIFWDENKRNTQITGRKKGWALLILFMLFNPIKELFKSAFNEGKRQ